MLGEQLIAQKQTPWQSEWFRSVIVTIRFIPLFHSFNYSHATGRSIFTFVSCSPHTEFSTVSESFFHSCSSCVWGHIYWESERISSSYWPLFSHYQWEWETQDFMHMTEHAFTTEKFNRKSTNNTVKQLFFLVISYVPYSLPLCLPINSSAHTHQA